MTEQTLEQMVKSVLHEIEAGYRRGAPCSGAGLIEMLSRRNLMIVEGFEPIGDKHKDGEPWLVTGEKDEHVCIWRTPVQGEPAFETRLKQKSWLSTDGRVYAGPTHAMPIPQMEGE